MDTFTLAIQSRVDAINTRAKLIKDIHTARAFTVEEVRAGYTKVIHDLLYRLMKDVDEFKTYVCSTMGDVDADSLLETSRFPNLATLAMLHG